MAIFDDVVVNAKSAAAVVSKNAGTLITLSKLRISLASLRSDLAKQYQALGEAVYNDDPAEEIEVIKSAITDLKQNIGEVEAVLASTRNTVTCPNCGEKLNKNALFCSTCGTPIAKENTCKKCGAELGENDKFCAACGEPVEAEAAAEEAPAEETEE